MKSNIVLENDTYFSTQCRFVASTWASSFTRCGLFPVFSSCCIVPTTISSLIPSTSTLLLPSTAGDGGGESSLMVVGFGLSSFMRMVVVRGGLIKPVDDESAPCDRFVFLTGGSPPSMMVLAGEGCDAALERLGTVMPNSASDSDFLLVLYGMSVCVVVLLLCR